MDSLAIIIIGGLFVAVLVIRNALLNARLDGFREAKRQVNNSRYEDATGRGCLEVLALIGFLAVCGLCFYAGVTSSAWAR